MSRRTTYYAITATTPIQIYKNGNQRYVMTWSIMSGPHYSRTEAEEQGHEKIGSILNEHGMSDISRATEHKNLIVVPKSSLHNYRIHLKMVYDLDAEY